MTESIRNKTFKEKKVGEMDITNHSAWHVVW